MLIGTAALICWRLARGEARFEPTIAPDADAIAALEPAPSSWTLPAGFGIGGPALRRDILIAFVVALAVLGTRGFRLDWPRDMYFDEVYHARTAFELLAEREPYEWTHPHLAKEIMALGILAFGDDRVVGAEPVPRGVTAFAVTNDGTRVFGLADGTIEVRPRDAQDSRVIGRVGSIPRSVAVDGDHVYVVADRDLPGR